jgi:hypothetical protein
MGFGRWKGVEWVWGSNWDLVGAAGAGDAVGDVELEDGVEVDEGEVEIGFGLEEGGGGGGVEGHRIRGTNRWLDEMT